MQIIPSVGSTLQWTLKSGPNYTTETTNWLGKQYRRTVNYWPAADRIWIFVGIRVDVHLKYSGYYFCSSQLLKQNERKWPL